MQRKEKQKNEQPMGTNSKCEMIGQKSKHKWWYTAL